MARKTVQKFVEQAQQVHGDRFDYSEVEYINTHTPVTIRCNQCGLVFLLEPSSHLAGRGCPKCSKKQTHKRVNQDLFIARAREVHGDKYDYSKTDYQNMRSKILIICPRHGEFYQRAQSHLLGSGCPMCKYDAHMESSMSKDKNDLKMDEELKKYIANLKRAARRKQNKQFKSRLLKYHAYYTVMSNFERDKMIEVFELLENEQTAYLSPIILWNLGCLDKSRHANMQNLIFDVDDAIREVVNESLLHALRILIDRTALYAHVLYPTFDKGKGFGNIDGNKRGGFIDFVFQELGKPVDELSCYNEKELCFFRYVKNEYDNWIHEFLQADNKVKHNGSLRPLYDLSKPIIVAPDAYELRNRNQQRTATLEINDWEEVMNKAYAFFDRVIEHVTTTI